MISLWTLVAYQHGQWDAASMQDDAMTHTETVERIEQIDRNIRRLEDEPTFPHDTRAQRRRMLLREERERLERRLPAADREAS